MHKGFQVLPSESRPSPPNPGGVMDAFASIQDWDAELKCWRPSGHEKSHRGAGSSRHCWESYSRSAPLRGATRRRGDGIRGRGTRFPWGRTTGASRGLPVCGPGCGLEEGWQGPPRPQPPLHAAGLPY